MKLSQQELAAHADAFLAIADAGGSQKDLDRAFAPLYEWAFGLVLRLASARTIKDAAFDAEDVASWVTNKLREKPPTGKGQNSIARIKGWLQMSTRNRLVDLQRRDHETERSGSRDGEDGPVYEPSVEPRIEDELYEKQRLERLKARVRGYRPGRNLLDVMVANPEGTPREWAVALDTSRDNVDQILNRIRKKLSGSPRADTSTRKKQK